ncbi:MAG: LEA type 2 family protein [Fibrobacteria bacterium]
MKTRAIAYLLLPLFLSACTFFKLFHSSKLKRPFFAYKKCVVKEVNDRRASIEIFLSAYNPNEVGLKGVAVDYELFSEGKRFLKGDGVKIELPPRDTTGIAIPAEIIYSDVFSAVGPAAARVMLGRETVPVRIDAVIYGNPTLYNEKEEGSLLSFSVKASRTENIPIPQDDLKKAKNAARDALKKLF